ncbi:MAG: hypothetical protein ABL986_03395 [Vicinamibacterales bacterium]
MSQSRRVFTVLLVLTAVISATSITSHAQEQAPSRNAAGAGWIAPGVFATWEAHRDAPADGQAINAEAMPLIVDLLVLWRGNPGWFDYAQVSAGAGGNGKHGVKSRGKSVELRFDRRNDSVGLLRDTLALQGANVLLLDDVDNPNGVIIAGTRRIEPLDSGSDGQAAGDPIRALIRQSPEVFEFLRCDPVFADPNDPGTAITLGACSQLR